MSSIEHGLPPVIFRDAHLLALDKPPGMPVQPDRTGDRSLLELVRAAFPAGEVGSPHRLDRPVSGVTLFTLDAGTLRHMDACFRERTVAKNYLAIVEGRTFGEGELRHALGHAGGTRKARVGEGTPNAALSYRTMAAGDRYSLLEVTPQGGAFHQIRAQLAAWGHAIKGDVKYGARRKEPDRSIALHAWRMRFPHPATGAVLEIEAKVPERSIWPVLWAMRSATG